MGEVNFAWGTIALVTVFLTAHFGEKRVLDHVPREIRSGRVVLWFLLFFAWTASLIIISYKLPVNNNSTWLIAVVAISGLRLIVIPPLIFSSQFMSEYRSKRALYSISASSLLSFAPAAISCLVLIALVVGVSIAAQTALTLK